MSPAATPLIIAHRGASFDAPENTLAAFKSAWQQGADGIETDIHLTADGRVVCIHDEDTKRLCADRANLVVRNTPYEVLKRLDVGVWKGGAWQGERIPTLGDALKTVPAGKFVFIELKTGPEIIEPLAVALQQSSLSTHQFVLISFDEAVMSSLGHQLPQYKRHLLAEYKQQPDGGWTPSANVLLARIRSTLASGLGTQNRPAHINEEFVERLRAGGVDEFHVWTVDDPNEGRLYQRLGAWALTTNRPAQLRSALLT